MRAFRIVKVGSGALAVAYYLGAAMNAEQIGVHDLAARAGLSVTAVERLLSGYTRAPRVGNVAAMLQVVGLRLVAIPTAAPAPDLPRGRWSSAGCRVGAPLVAGLHRLIADRGTTVGAVALRAGARGDVLGRWFAGAVEPTLPALERAYGALGYRLEVRRIGGGQPHAPAGMEARA